jgi:N-acetyldiaminopimelate deacetylase
MKTLQQIRRDLHQIPEIGFHEFKTQAYLLNEIYSMNQERLTVVKWKTGIVVHVKGLAPKKTIGWRSDIDGLPINEQTGFSYESIHPGFMHACGHDIHMTVALGLLRLVNQTPINDHMVFLFQPAEEGPVEHCQCRNG